MSHELTRQLRFARDGGPLRRWSRMAVPGTGFLSVGLAGFCFIIMGVSLVLAVQSWHELPLPWISLLAWLIVLLVIFTAAITVVRLGERMPASVAIVTVTGIVLATALDLLANVSLGNGIMHSFAAIAAGSALLVLVALRSTLEALVPILAYSITMGLVVALSSLDSPELLVTQLPLLTLATVPSLACVLIVREYRHIVHVHLDRTLLHSSVHSPSAGSNLLVGAELARLDLAAETLLQEVADGKRPLPLPRAQAHLAAELATELRLNLIEGRRETWLYHAVQDSSVLAKIVTIDDAESLAGLLGEEQRDGLLGALWQLAVLRSVSEPEIVVVFSPAEESAVFPNGALLPISINIRGLRRSRITPAIWESVQQLGDSSGSGLGSHARIEIQCHVPDALNH